MVGWALSVAKRPFNPYQLAKYFSASVLNTLLGVAIIFVLYRLTDAPYITLVLSSLIGYIYSICSYHYIAFSGKGRKPPYKRYALTYFTALGLNTGITSILMLVTRDFMVIQAIVLPIIVGLQWLAANYWVFKPDR